MVRIASWSTDQGLSVFSHLRLFPEKFSNFHGATVPVTGLPWPPFIIQFEEKAIDGSVVKKYKGPDGLLLRAAANTLNFTFSFLRSVTGVNDAADRVVERKSFMLVVFHVVLHTRLERYDYSYPYTFVSFGFGLAKPVLKPQWQSLYYPLADEVWASTLAALLLMSALIYMVSMIGKSMLLCTVLRTDALEVDLSGSIRKSRDIGAMMQEIFGTLVGQNLSNSMRSGSSNHALVAAWLIFSFILGTVYRGNLTAALTLPKYPPRPETVEELVNYVDRVTMPPFGKDWQKQFRESGSVTLEKLADLMYTGPSILEGLKQANEKKQAHLAARNAINHWIAEHFTGADGNSLMYFGRESIDPGASAWPLPHDAPYKRQLDAVMMTVNEAGLYNKWTHDTVEEAKRDGRRKQRERRWQEESEQASEGTQPGTSTSSIKALTIVHMQGPLILLLLGLVFAGLTFTTEILSERCRCR
ncbi:ionotropic receptor 21a-like [Panulirus ornatus]|uniref:ionotropic receptor 21a-like n=1 Tax=Panulirus ornatus TaxID=150431 RepID=UPI003A89734B